ncbi:hypothetical protein SynRS9915_01989 [Synechococcus sp. RS9915]|nr:hypothetical protein SynRS9915_01989 [Synechococcus sp. RS9915]
MPAFPKHKVTKNTSQLSTACGASRQLSKVFTENPLDLVHFSD